MSSIMIGIESQVSSMGKVGIKNCYRYQRSLIWSTNLTIGWVVSLMLSWMCVRVMMRNHISLIMMYGKFLQLFSRPSGHIVRRRYVKKYLINLNGRKGTGDHNEGGRRMMSLFDNVVCDTSDLKYDQPVVYLTNYCTWFTVVGRATLRMSMSPSSMSWVASTTPLRWI